MNHQPINPIENIQIAVFQNKYPKEAVKQANFELHGFTIIQMSTAVVGGDYVLTVLYER